jgi:hypothetical protein
MEWDSPRRHGTEATEEEIAGVVAGSSANGNGVGTLDSSFADPPDAESLRGMVNEVMVAMRRMGWAGSVFLVFFTMWFRQDGRPVPE